MSAKSERPTNWRRGAWAIIVIGLLSCVLAGRSWMTDRHDSVEQIDRNSLSASRGAGKASQGRQTVVAMAEIPPSQFTSQRAADLAVGLDPASVGWTSEKFNDASAAQLYRLADILARPSQATEESLSEIITDRFACDALRPGELVEVYADANTRVRRMQNVELVERVDDLLSSAKRLPHVSAASHAFVALKNVRLNPIDDAAGEIETVVRAEGQGKTPDGTVQWTASWRCLWHQSSLVTPRLASIRVLEYEETTFASDSGTWLTDRTSAVMFHADGYADQLMIGMDDWVNRLEHRVRVGRLGHNGISLGDVNGDGREDLYVCQSGGLPNRLYVQQRDGKVVDIASDAGVDFLDDTTCALLIDLDNDGDQDLVLVTVAGALVMANDGAGRFQIRSHLEACRNSFSLTATDFDQDGLLDLYVGRYWSTEATRGEIPIPVPYYDANNGGRNVLLRNLGNWQFQDVTDQVGLDVDNRRYTLAAAWEDLDQDGDIDLYVANDFGRNCWYRNEGGRFINQAAAAGLEDIASGMAVTFADFDQNGWFDIHVSNMFSTAGNRTTFQPQFRNVFAPGELAKIQRLARGNSLFANAGRGQFEDASLSSGVTMGRWAWGSLFVDLNNDSWDDLVVANGFITTEDTGDL